MIPVIINNRNRLSMLSRLIAWLEATGSQDIFIIDNASTYEPLLDYYRSSPHTVFRLKDNVGYLALWETGLYETFRRDYYVYTDPDVLPVQECPQDYLEVFLEGLRRYPRLGKVGFSLKIDDLPDHYAARNAVLQHESPFWAKPVDARYLDALIDTTFALYRPGARGGYWCPAFRTAPPYCARHLPWYEDSSKPSEEELYYRSRANRDATWTADAGAKETLPT